MLHEKLGYSRRGAWVVLLGLTLTTAGWAQGTLACGLDGGGEANDPWLVTSAEDLAKVGVADCWLSGYYSQTADEIDLSTYSNWYPIGSSSGNSFSGTYDGGGHAITGLVINSPLMDGVGLFGYNTGTLKNLHVSGNVTGFSGVGVLVGMNYGGTLDQVTASGSVTGNSGGVGGLVGAANASTLTQASASASVHAASSPQVGGLVGAIWKSTLTQASASGSVTGGSSVGGLVGYAMESTLTQASASGSVTGNNYVGGLVGGSGYAGILTITKAIASGSVTGNNYVGGLLGFNDSGSESEGTITITDSFWDMDATGQHNGIGDGIPAPGLLGKTTPELQTLATFTAVEWPIVAGWQPPASAGGTVWGICPAPNASYPFLLWSYTTDPCLNAPDIAEVTSYIKEARNDGILTGVGTGPSANNKINALVNMIETAGDLLQGGVTIQGYLQGSETIQGCQQLADIALKVDGAPKPPDFVQGPGQAHLAELIQGLRKYYGCE